MKRIAISTLVIVAFGFGAAAAAEPSSDPRVADIVKSGTIRACFGMNPTIAFNDPQTGQLRGPALDLARALADRTGVALTPIAYPSPGAVIPGMETKACDLTFLVFDPGRAGILEFSPPYMQTDFTYLVPAGTAEKSVADVDRSGVRIAVVRNDASDLTLTRLIKQAELLRADDINLAVEMLRTGQAQAVAAPRPVLFAQSAKLGGFRVLNDGFAQISYAAVVPKDSAGWLAYVSEFVEDAKASGLVKRTIESAGLEGVQVSPRGNSSGR